MKKIKGKPKESLKNKWKQTKKTWKPQKNDKENTENQWKKQW